MATGRGNKLTSQIGEFLVCAELGRQGLIATPFAGNVPKFDLIVADNNCQTIPIQVKASNSNNWPSKATLWMQIEFDDANKKQIYHGPITIDDPDLIYVCVAIAQTQNQRDRFFILNRRELQQICIKNYCTCMNSRDWKRPRNYKSLDCRYSISDLVQYENRWSLIEKELKK